MHELMTVAEEIAKLKNQVRAIEQNRPFATAVQSVHAVRVVRIFDTGIAGAEYEKTKPLYASDKQLRRAGNNTGKNGKSIKSSYYKSYFDLKQQQGFNPEVVNLRMTNDLQSDFANAQLSAGDNLNVGKAIKINDNIYIEAIRRSENVGKLRGLKKKYGDFTRFTQTEREQFNTVLQRSFNRLLKNINK